MLKICLLADANSIHTIKWVNYLSDAGYDIYLVSMNRTDYEYDSKVKTYFILPGFKCKLSYLLLINKFKKIVRQINPDVLHSYYASSYGFIGEKCNFHPFYVSAWGSDVYQFPKYNIINKMLLKSVFKSADKVLATSKDLAHEIKMYSDKKVLITPFGVDTDKFTVKNEIFNNKGITIGITKNVEKIYGINYLIKAFYLLVHRNADLDLRLLIVGDGSRRQELEKLVSSLDISNKVKFIGHVVNDKIPDYINMMDIVCVPSISESFGVSAVEALACGRPVVCSNVGGLKELIVDGYNGYKVRAKDPEDLYEKIEYLIQNKRQAIAMSANARECAVSRYNFYNNAKIMKDSYEI